MALMALKKAAGAAVLPIATVLDEGGTSTGFDVTSVMSESVTSVQSQLFSVLAIVVPAIVAVTAAIVAVKFGINWLKKLQGGRQNKRVVVYHCPFTFYL